VVKNFDNQSAFGKAMGMRKVSCSFDSRDKCKQQKDSVSSAVTIIWPAFSDDYQPQTYIDSPGKVVDQMTTRV